MTEDLNSLDDYPDTHGKIVLKLADAQLRYQIRLVLPVLAVAVILSTVLVGLTGLWGSLVGSAVALASSAFTMWLMRISAHQGPHLVMAAALGGFVGKMIILLVVLTLLGDVTALHRYALALTMLAGVMVAAVADGVAFKKTKLPTIIPS
jgi:ATP synthase protein I